MTMMMMMTAKPSSAAPAAKNPLKILQCCDVLLGYLILNDVISLFDCLNVYEHAKITKKVGGITVILITL